MEAFNRTLRLINRVPNAILVINLTMLAVMGDLVLTHIIEALPYFNLNILEWRLAPLSDHVAIYLAMGVFYLIRLYQRGYRKTNWWNSFAPVLAFGDVMIVFGLCQVMWGYIVASHNTANLAAYVYQANVEHVPGFTLFFAGAQYLMFLGVGLYISGSKRTLLVIAGMLPVYLIWMYIGSPISLESAPNGAIVMSKLYDSVWVNGLEVGAWVWAMTLIVITDWTPKAVSTVWVSSRRPKAQPLNTSLTENK